MGHRHLSAGREGLILLLLASALPSQGPLYRERWGFLHLQRLRLTVLHELQGRDAATRQQVADLLAAPDRGIPFRGPTAALALLRGVTADDAFSFRSMVSAYVLPEVVDPKADNANCRELNLSVFLPYLAAAPGEVAFDVEVRGPGGEVVFQTAITESTAPADLRTAQARAVVPAGELADGRHEVSVRTRLAGEAPRAQDYVLRHHFAVLRGYQKRAEAAMQSARLAVDQQAELPAALLRGLAGEVVRAYAGEAFAVDSTAVADLQRLEAALQNVAAGKPPLAGMHGRVTAALPAGSQRPLAVTFELPQDATPKPLLLLAPAGPAYDPRAQRPGEPATTSPRWAAALADGLDGGGRYHVVCLESTGTGIDYGQALLRAIELLPQLLPVMPGRVVLVAEREAAVAASFKLPELQRQLRGLALVSGGGLSRQALEGLQGLHLLLCPAQDDPASDGLLRTRDLVAGKYGELKSDVEFALDPPAGKAWLFGIPQSRDAILALCARAFADR